MSSMFSYDEDLIPPGPSVYLRIIDARRRLGLPRFAALIDTGADVSCLPKWIVDKGPPLDYDWVPVEAHDGRRKMERFVRILNATVEFSDEKETVLVTKEYKNLRLLILPWGLLGRDLLNSHVCELDGPRLTSHLR